MPYMPSPEPLQKMPIGIEEDVCRNAFYLHIEGVRIHVPFSILRSMRGTTYDLVDRRKAKWEEDPQMLIDGLKSEIFQLKKELEKYKRKGELNLCSRFLLTRHSRP